MPSPVSWRSWAVILIGLVCASAHPVDKTRCCSGTELDCANPCEKSVIPDSQDANVPAENEVAFNKPSCCMPEPGCYNPCFQQFMQRDTRSNIRFPYMFAQQERRPNFAPNLDHGEITFKLKQDWNAEEYLDPAAPGFQILEGNVRKAVQAVLGPSTYVSNVYFTQGENRNNVNGRPKTVVHLRVNGGSDAASYLERSTYADGSLGDGLKVYKDSFNAY